MRKQLLILLVALAVLAVPVAAEEKNWTYTFDSSVQTVSAGLTFGCNLVTTDYVDVGYDLTAPPPPPGSTAYAYERIYESAGVFSSQNFVQALNAPMSPSNDETVFFVEFASDGTNDVTKMTPFTITWDPVADASLTPTITGITLVNLSDTSETYDMMSAGSTTGTSFVDFMGTILVIPRTYSINVTYNLPVPVADFSGTPTSVTEGDTVTFTDASTGIIDSWSWDFGAGEGTSTLQNPTHVYNTQGTYTVTLTATNEAGSDAEVKTDYITVTGPPPVANFTFSPASPQAGDTVDFQDTSTGTVTSWLWDFGDGATASTATPSHIYAVAGTYTVNLTATNGGGSNSFQDTVTVSTQSAPTADFSGTPTSGEAPFTVTFTDASTGYNITSWAWDFGDGVGTSTAQNPSYQYTLEGVYNVSLTATNDGGSDAEIKTDYITVTGPAPVASFTTNVTTGEAPLTVNFTDTSTAFAGANIVSWVWDFGDGVGTSTSPNPVYTYTSPGSYDVNLTVTDDATTPASNTSAPTNIMVSGPAPVADFSGTPTLVSVMNGLVSFTDLSTSADFTVTTWDWAFGDMGTSIVQNPNHTYTTKGYYTVSLTAGDNQVPQKTDTETKVGYIEVVNAPTADFSWTGSPAVAEGYSPVTVTFTDASAADGNATLSGWAWDFGAAGSASVQAPTPVSFTTPGWYDISLNVTDNAGGYDTETKDRIVHVYNATPTASFTAAPLTGDASLAVTFTDTSTGVVDTYAWDFGDGGTSAVASPVYTFNTPGLWNVTLTVTNDGGSDTSAATQINVTQPPVPVPDFTASTRYGHSPLTVQFMENITGNWTSVLWEFEDSGRIFTSTDPNPEYTFYLLGMHNVSLTAYNALGNMTVTKVDYISVSLPVSDGDSDYSGSQGSSTPSPTAVPTSEAGATPTVTPVPTTSEPTQETTPVETVTSVPTATSTTTGTTGQTGDTGGFPWVYAVIVVVIIAIVGGYFMMNKKE